MMPIRFLGKHRVRLTEEYVLQYLKGQLALDERKGEKIEVRGLLHVQTWPWSGAPGSEMWGCLSHLNNALCNWERYF